jgi:heme/copper-type cytochrome/quinol oxidase subunit 4
MKKLQPLSLLLLFAFMLSSCDAIGGIFKAGMWTGIIVVVAVIILIIWLISRGHKS